MTADRFKWLEFGDDDGSSDAARHVPAWAPAGRAADTGKDDRWHVEQARREFLDGEYEPALRDFSAAIGYRADVEEAWVGQVRCLVALGQMEQAATWGNKGLAKLPSSLLMASAAAWLMARAGQAAQALQLSDQVMAQGGDGVAERPEILVDRAVCVLAAGNRETAAATFERVLKLVANDADWLQRIGIELLASNEPAQALKVFNRALEQRPDRPHLWVLTARAALALNLGSRAQEALAQAIKLNPDNAEAEALKRKLGQTARPVRPCWIATMVFESPEHPVVSALRGWRDEVWMCYSVGRAAADLYDATAPWVCRVLARFRGVHAPLRWLLFRIACWSGRRIEARGEPTSSGVGSGRARRGDPRRALSSGESPSTGVGTLGCAYPALMRRNQKELS